MLFVSIGLGPNMPDSDGSWDPMNDPNDYTANQNKWTPSQRMKQTRRRLPRANPILRSSEANVKAQQIRERPPPKLASLTSSVIHAPRFSFNTSPERWDPIDSFDLVVDGKPGRPTLEPAHPHPFIAARRQDLQDMNPTPERVVEDCAVLLGGEAAKGFRFVINTINDSPRVGPPAREPVLDRNGIPILRGNMLAIWTKFINAERKAAEQAGTTTWSADGYAAPWGDENLDNSIVVTMEKPCSHEGTNANSAYNFSDRYGHRLLGKLGYDRLDTPTTQHGATLFLLDPRNK
jgi:hypothetical protein